MLIKTIISGVVVSCIICHMMCTSRLISHQPYVHRTHIGVRAVTDNVRFHLKHISLFLCHISLIIFRRKQNGRKLVKNGSAETSGIGEIKAPLLDGGVSYAERSQLSLASVILLTHHLVAHPRIHVKAYFLASPMPVVSDELFSHSSRPVRVKDVK